MPLLATFYLPHNSLQNLGKNLRTIRYTPMQIVTVIAIIKQYSSITRKGYLSAKTIVLVIVSPVIKVITIDTPDLTNGNTKMWNAKMKKEKFCPPQPAILGAIANSDHTPTKTYSG